MARLIICYDPNEKIQLIEPMMANKNNMNLSQALLDIADDLDKTDIYEIARKLAEMLLEQL